MGKGLGIELQQVGVAVSSCIRSTKSAKATTDAVHSFASKMKRRIRVQLKEKMDVAAASVCSILMEFGPGSQTRACAFHTNYLL